MTRGLEIKKDIVGQCNLGGEEFVKWVKEEVLGKKTDKECPQLIKLENYKKEDMIIKAIEKEAGKLIGIIKAERGILRQLTMDLLYRLGGLNNREIGEMFGVDYSTVSQGRKRVNVKISKDKKLQEMMKRIETNCQE